jgi:hypothetical protein
MHKATSLVCSKRVKAFLLDGIRLGRIFDVPIYIYLSWVVVFFFIAYLNSARFAQLHPQWALNRDWITAVLATLLFFKLHPKKQSLPPLPLPRTPRPKPSPFCGLLYCSLLYFSAFMYSLAYYMTHIQQLTSSVPKNNEPYRLPIALRFSFASSRAKVGSPFPVNPGENQ